MSKFIILASVLAGIDSPFLQNGSACDLSISLLLFHLLNVALSKDSEQENLELSF